MKNLQLTSKWLRMKVNLEKSVPNLKKIVEMNRQVVEMLEKEGASLS